jgi:E3 ubiquitin-protein ligase HUWE1
MTISNDFGRIETDNKRTSTSKEVLEAQAAAHWHRVISHARDQRLAAQAAGEEVPCPLCGQMTDDPKFCGFCGDIEEATQAHLAMHEAKMGEQDNKKSSFSLFGGGSRGSSPDGSPSGDGGGSPGSPSALRVLWNRDSQAYDRVEVQGGGSPSKGSPGSPHRRSVQINSDNVRDEMTEMMGMLMAPTRGSPGGRRSNDGEDGGDTFRPRKTAKELKAEAARMREEETADEERKAALAAARESPKRRKFEGLGLDSSDDDDSTDANREKKDKEKRLKELEAADDGWDQDDSDAEGNTAWERSPFFRLLNANTIKDKDGSANSLNAMKKIIGRYDDDPDAGVDLDEAGEAPEPPLPPIEITLKSRTATSIDLAWDVSEPMMDMLEAVRSVYGRDKKAVYQAQYRPHNAKEAADEHEGLSGSGKGGSKDGGEKWKIAVRRTLDQGVTVEGLTPNTPYQFRARRIGWTTLKECQPVVIRSGPGPPSVPKNVTAKEVSSESILLAWQVPEKDNGLPVREYIVHHKPYKGSFQQAYKGVERCFLITDLPPNQVHIFQVQAVNRAGKSEMSDRTAVRTLPAGAQPMSPWVEVIDERTNKMFYCHSKTNAIAWTRPSGSLIDDAASFKNKRIYLQNEMERRMALICKPYGVTQRVLQIAVQRENVLESSLRLLHHTPPTDIDAGPIRVRFHGEDGLDAGGLAKDWYQEVARRLHDDSTGLLIVNDDTGYVTIDPRASHIHEPPELARLFRAIGTFLAKAIIDKQTLGVSLDPLLLAVLSGKTPTIFPNGNKAPGSEDDGVLPPDATTIRYSASINGQSVMQLAEPQFFRGLKWCISNDVTDAELSFSCSYELFDEAQEIELVPYGLNKLVTQENKGEYVDLMAHWLFRERYEPALGSLLEGFEAHISINKYMRLFTLDEIQLLLGGRPDIDLKDIRKDAQFTGGYDEDSAQVEWLWVILQEFDVEKLSLFLGFISGCASMPVDGLDPPLMITQMEDSDRDAEGMNSALPRAHTCFNQLVLPPYADHEIMRDKLLYALENASQGFYIT